MKREKLLAALDVLFPVVSRTTIVEEMGNFWFTDSVIRTTDGLTQMQVTLAEPTGLSCLVPASKFYKLLQSLSIEDVDLTVKDGTLVIKSGRVVGKIQVGVDAQILSELDFDVDAWLPIEKDDLAAALRACVFSVSGDVSRGIMCGILVKNNYVYSTDGYRASRYQLKRDTMQTVVVPADLVMRAMKHSPDGWAVKNDIVYFRVGNNTIIGGKVLQGDYPSVEVENLLVLPSGMNTIEWPKGAGESAYRHELMMDDLLSQDRTVQVTIDGKLLTLASQAENSGLTETFDLAEDSGEVRFKIHSTFLGDILSRTKTMKHSDKLGFVVFGDSTFTHLMMVDKT